MDIPLLELSSNYLRGAIFAETAQASQEKNILILEATDLDVEMNEMSSTNGVAVGESVEPRQVGFRYLGQLGEVNIRWAGVQNLAVQKKSGHTTK